MSERTVSYIYMRCGQSLKHATSVRAGSLHSVQRTTSLSRGRVPGYPRNHSVPSSLIIYEIFIEHKFLSLERHEGFLTGLMKHAGIIFISTE